MATKHDGSANDPDQQLMCDIDLASFARPRSEYRKDCENIRYEYRAVPDNIYRTKRIETLQSFLARPSIYYTCQFRYRFEAAARENLEQEIHDLKVCERVCG